MHRRSITPENLQCQQCSLTSLGRERGQCAHCTADSTYGKFHCCPGLSSVLPLQVPQVPVGTSVSQMKHQYLTSENDLTWRCNFLITLTWISKGYIFIQTILQLFSSLPFNVQHQRSMAFYLAIPHTCHESHFLESGHLTWFWWRFWTMGHTLLSHATWLFLTCLSLKRQ